MKKILIISLSMILISSLATGCNDNKKEESKGAKQNDDNQSVIKDQIYDGLEFVNVSIKNDIITTIIINNTGVIYEGSKFKIKVLDDNGKVLAEIIDEVKESVETGNTKVIETKTTNNLSNAAAIEYSIIRWANDVD